MGLGSADIGRGVTNSQLMFGWSNSHVIDFHEKDACKYRNIKVLHDQTLKGEVVWVSGQRVLRFTNM